MTKLKLNPERISAFQTWYRWSLENLDADPAIWMIRYLNRRYEHNTEERFWLSWLYGNTYQVPSAWVIKNEFPDFSLVDQKRIEEWNTNNYPRLRYQTDTKYNKGHLPKMFASYREMIGDQTQETFYRSLMTGKNPQENFDLVYNHLMKNLYKFGRYTCWFYIQTLVMTCKLDLRPSTLLLNDHSGSKSHRNGLLLATGNDDLVDQKLEAKQTEYLEQAARDIVAGIKHPDNNLFMLESCLCSFKKIFRDHSGRYLGYYLDRQAEEIMKAERDGWSGIQWNVLWQARNETLSKELARNTGVMDDRCFNILKTGAVLTAQPLVTSLWD